MCTPGWRGCKITRKGGLFFFTPPKRVTSPTWGSPLPCKQSLRAKCWLRRGVGGQFARNVLSSIIFFTAIRQSQIPRLIYHIYHKYITVQAYVQDGWAFRMSCLKSPYLTSKPVEDPPHSRRYALGACGLHNCINMQLLCNYVD